MGSCPVRSYAQPWSASGSRGLTQIGGIWKVTPCGPAACLRSPGSSPHGPHMALGLRMVIGYTLSYRASAREDKNDSFWTCCQITFCFKRSMCLKGKGIKNGRIYAPWYSFRDLIADWGSREIAKVCHTSIEEVEKVWRERNHIPPSRWEYLIYGRGIPPYQLNLMARNGRRKPDRNDLEREKYLKREMPESGEPRALTMEERDAWAAKYVHETRDETVSHKYGRPSPKLRKNAPKKHDWTCLADPLPMRKASRKRTDEPMQQPTLRGNKWK